MADIDNQDQQAIVDDLVNNAMVPDADAVDILATAELGAAMRPWLNGQRIDGICGGAGRICDRSGPAAFFLRGAGSQPCRASSSHLSWSHATAPAGSSFSSPKATRAVARSWRSSRSCTKSGEGSCAAASSISIKVLMKLRKMPFPRLDGKGRHGKRMRVENWQ